MIKQTPRGCVLTFGMVGMLSVTSQAYTAGLQITEQSVTGLGRAFAGGSLANDDASAAYYNPADMMLGRGSQAQVGMTFIGITVKADNAGSSRRLPASAGTVPSGRNDDGGTDNLVPNAYYILDINDRMRFGLSVNAPFVVNTSYGKGWVGRYHALDSGLITVDINPSIAYRVNDQLSIGGGVSAQYAKAKLTQALFNPLSPATDGDVEIKVDDWGVGFNLGATYEIDPATRLGLSYRSRIHYSLEGDRTISNYIPGRNGEVAAQVDFTAPDWAGLGLYKRLDDKWAVMGSVRWTNWSLFQELRPQYADGTQTVIQEKWDDSWAFNIGISYDYSSEWTFRAGYVYDQTPVQSAEYRNPRIPDSDRNAFAIGFSYHPHSQMSLDFGYMYILFDDSSTRNTIDLLSTAPGLVTDTLRLDYSSYGHLVGLQANYRF